MKVIFTILILVSNLTLFAQADKAIGDYEHITENKEGYLYECKLTLHQDGAFDFHYHSIFPNRIPREESKYGKGKTTIENNVVTFFSDKQIDLDEKHTLDFTNTKARFIIKHPRNKTDQIIKTRLKFLESGFWIKGWELFKI